MMSKLPFVDREITPPELKLLDALHQLENDTFNVARDHGFVEASDQCPRELLFAGVHMALICSEACEALEVIRTGDLEQPSKKVPGITALQDEFADIVIRVAMIAKKLGVDLARGVVVKHAFNEARPWKHGGKMF